jgi:hypothetical protein
MNLMLKLTTSILLITTTTLISCSKDPGNNSTTQPPAITDTLSGKEFTFSGLIWNYWLDSFNELSISIENRPDFFGTNRTLEVFVKSVLDTAWIPAHTNVIPGYTYGIVYSRHLYVSPYPYIQPWSANTQLAGTRASLKIRFF